MRILIFSITLSVFSACGSDDRDSKNNRSKNDNTHAEKLDQKSTDSHVEKDDQNRNNERSKNRKNIETSQSDSPSVNKGENDGDSPQNKAIAKLKGYHAMNQLLQHRLLNNEGTDGRRLNLARYLDTSYFPGAPGLIDLLGVYKGNGRQNQFVNGTPSSTNMLLWFLILRDFSRDVVQQACDKAGFTEFKVRNDIKATIKPFCRGLPQASLAQKHALWQAVMAYDAPKSERGAWIKFVKQETSNNVEKVEDALAAILMNPYFLLKL